MNSSFDFSDINNVSDIYAVKILLCYFLKKINRPVTPLQLLEIATSENIVNYFTYNHAVDSMLESGLVAKEEIDGEECLRLTEKGLDGAEEFKTMAPKTAREKILAAGLRFFARLKIENDVNFAITTGEKGCVVRCECNDNGTRLMNLELFAPDTEQAELIVKKIKMNPDSFYAQIMDFVLDNSEFKPEVKD